MLYKYNCSHNFKGFRQAKTHFNGAKIDKAAQKKKTFKEKASEFKFF